MLQLSDWRLRRPTTAELTGQRSEHRKGTGTEDRPEAMAGPSKKADCRPQLRQEWDIVVEEQAPCFSKVKARVSSTDRTWRP